MPRAPSTPLPALARPLSAAASRELAGALAQMLRWQRDLRGWPRTLSGLAGTPIVSLYLDGTLRGCSGMSAGPPRERLARAFLQALADERFGGVAPAERGRLVAQVAYPLRFRAVALERAAGLLEPGVHGLVLSRSGEAPAVLLPDVAREHELDAAGFLSALEHKVGLERAAWGAHRLHTFETDAVVARLGPARTAARSVEPRDVEPVHAAVRWLARRVAEDGAVTFGVEPRRAEQDRDGLMHHGRAAVVVQALSLHAVGRTAAARARAWLERELARGLQGRLATFPREAALVAGTLALAKLAGVACDAPLREIATSPALAAVPWHAAQVVCALGADAPRELYRACVQALDTEPRAPWTALAARAVGDRETYVRVARTLVTCIPVQAPYAGGVRSETLPEVALTALFVEALAGANDRSARAACARALRFVLGQQHLAHVPADVVEPALAHGAFPLTPVHAYLRTDVTAHAVLALAATRA